MEINKLINNSVQSNESFKSELNDKSELNNAFELNNILQKNTNMYNLLSTMVEIKGNYKFIASIYRKNELVLRFDYIVIGSYHKTKNVWIWADQSLTLPKSIIKQIKNIRNDLHTDFHDFDNDSFYNILHQFIDHDYFVLTTSDLKQCIFHIGTKLYNDTEQKYKIITFSRTNDIIDFFISKRILFSSLK